MTQDTRTDRAAGAPGGAPWFYRAFGLRLRSDFAFAALEPAGPGPSDVSIDRLEGVPGPADGTRTIRFDFEADEHLMAWEELGEYRVLGRDRIGIRPRPGVDPRLLELPMLGPVLATLLHLRGALVLHASAIAVNGAGIVLLGDKGAGKSTTAAALLAAGHRLLSDDVVAISIDGRGRPMIAPAFNQIKLADDAAGALSHGAAGALALDADIRRGPEHPAIVKRPHVVATGLSPAPVEARAFHVLERGGPAGVRPLAGADAAAALVRFSYAARFGRAALPPRIAARHLGQCARASEGGRVGRLGVPDGLGRLSETVAEIERHCGNPEGATA